MHQIRIIDAVLTVPKKSFQITVFDDNLIEVELSQTARRDYS